MKFGHLQLLLSFVAVGLLFVASPVLAGLKINDHVECLWKNGSAWYPGVVAERKGASVYIHYNDGDKELTTVDKCRTVAYAAPAGGLGIGARVRCYWKGGTTLFPGVIADRTGDSVFIHYDDGDRERTTIGYCQPR